MLGIELDGIKKLEIAFCVLVLSTAGFFFYTGTVKSKVDTNVAAWTEDRKVPVNDKLPLSASNPMDPKRSTIVSIFASQTSEVEITEYPAETGFKATVRMRYGTGRDAANVLAKQWKKVEKVSDPAKRAIMFSGYMAAEGRKQGILYAAGLRTEQRTKAIELAKQLDDQVVLLEEDMKQGLLEPALQNDVMAALEAYRTTEGDVTRDRKKMEAAAKVQQVALEYLAKVQAKKSEAVEKYVGEVYAMLDEDQKKKVAERGQEIASRTTFRRPAKMAG